WPVARRQPLATEDGPALSPRRDDFHARPGRHERHGDARRGQLQRTNAAQRRPLPGYRAGALVEWPHGGADDAVSQPDHPAAGEFAVDAPHPAGGARRLRFRLDPFRLCRRHARDDTPPIAPGQSVRTGRLRVGRRWRSHRTVAGGVRTEAAAPRAGRTGRAHGGKHRTHGDRDADTRHVRVLAARHGGLTAWWIFRLTRRYCAFTPTTRPRWTPGNGSNGPSSSLTSASTASCRAKTTSAAFPWPPWHSKARRCCSTGCTPSARPFSTTHTTSAM